MSLTKTTPKPIISGSGNRQKVWLNLIPSTFIQECDIFYRETKTLRQITIPARSVSEIRKDAAKTVCLHIKTMETEDKVKKIVSNLGMFVLKRPDIGYHYGFTFIMGFLHTVFTVDQEAFVVFCYIVEKIFPEDFFLDKDREIGMHRELRVIEMMAEKLRPKILNNFKAVFTPSGGKNKETDFSAFVMFVKRTVEVWLKCLFVPHLTVDDTYRVWDSLLYYGYEFLIKFTLTLFSNYETFINNTVKKEIKLLGIGISIDALIITGNLTRAKLLRKAGKLKIEKLIKKAMNKKTYAVLKRENFLANSENLENENTQRIFRIRNTKKLIQGKSLWYDSVKKLFNSLNTLSYQGQISRNLFVSICTKEMEWSIPWALSVYNTLDQLGNDTLPIEKIKIGLSILSSTTLQEKIDLFFSIFDITNSGKIHLDEICDLIIIIEDFLDNRLRFFRSNFTSLKQALLTLLGDLASKSDFENFFLSNQSTDTLIKMIEAIDSDDNLNPYELRFINIAEEGIYSNTQSPLRTSSIDSPGSEKSYEGPDFNELDQKIMTLAKSQESQNLDNESLSSSYIKKSSIEPNGHNKIMISQHLRKSSHMSLEKLHPEIIAEIDCCLSDCDDIYITNEYEENKIKFILHFGVESKSSEDFENLVIHGEKMMIEEPVKNFMGTANIETYKEIDIPQQPKNDKSRVGCSRLCSASSCIIS
ncbi:hypothetical protein SteCoe_25548 [Stentor coeruleus]|uniref:Rab-GAP TBC domain-containing protein n=1 Tax=Stentor coeruleus TaxID=5963 RepID=A0A1R2BEV7_9CILI|nr:hypothetical protein SteCoe_25548 [Stentor coeruleus]